MSPLESMHRFLVARYGEEVLREVEASYGAGDVNNIRWPDNPPPAKEIP